MNSKTKIILTVVGLSVVASFAVIQVKNKELVQGQIFGDKTVVEELGTPDLVPVIEPTGADENGNLKVRITVKNMGEGPVTGDNPYNYTLYINDEIVLTNTDSYTKMDPGDSFSFIYPIDKEIYNYPESGTVKVIVDKDEQIEESDEGNNESIVGYEL